MSMTDRTKTVRDNERGPGATEDNVERIKEIHGSRPAEVIAITTGRIAEQRVSEDGQEGMRAFLEKRKPRWVRPS